MTDPTTADLLRDICAVDDCARPVLARGWCKLHYERWRNKGSPHLRPRPTADERFWAQVDRGSPDECWNWTGSLANGYGRFALGSVTDGQVMAHRHAISLAGVDPTGWFVCHRCDNRQCVNPDHLFLGTHDDNMRDMVDKGRSTRGRKQWAAKLTEGAVVKLRRLKLLGWTTPQITERTGVSKSLIDSALRKWKHVPAEDPEGVRLLAALVDAWDDFATDAAGPWERRLDDLVEQAKAHLNPVLEVQTETDPAPAVRCCPGPPLSPGETP